MMVPTLISLISSFCVKSMAFFSPQASTQVFLHLSVSDAAFEVQADLRVDQHHLRRGLRERDIDRLALAQALVELVGNFGSLIDAVGDALLAAGAEVLVDVARLALHRDRVVAHVAVHLGHLRVAPERDVRVRADRGHLGRQNAGRAVQRREGLVELGHVAADGRLALDEVDLLAGVGQRHGGVDAGDAAADHQHVGVDGHLLHFERLVDARRARWRRGPGPWPSRSLPCGRCAPTSRARGC